MSMKIVYSMAVIICAAMWFGSCQNEELDYYPLKRNTWEKPIPSML